ncbi:MAG: type IX secretion system sortase PorU [Bacteroidales bacterium]|nr:type IX secretion system sortase PorU [Bacteroidales bacterium]
MKKGLLYILILGHTLCAVAQGSVLGSGRWWKMTVDTEGLYRLTTAEMPALQGASIDSIGIYGMGGGMLPLLNSEVSTEGLCPLAIDIIDHNGDGIFGTGDTVLFFGEGADRWYYASNDGRWEHERHAYANHNYYYLTTSTSNPRRITYADLVTATETVNSYTSVDYIDNDLVNVFRTGQKWMGEKFGTGVTSRTFTLQVTGNSDGYVKLRYALANQSSTSSQFTVSTPGYNNHVGINSRTVYSTTLDAFSTTASSFDFTITFAGGESTAAGYLDFFELNSHAPLRFNGGQLIVRNDQNMGTAATFTANGVTSRMRVWDVTQTGNEREMAVSNGTWSDSTVAARRYIIFDGSSFLTPANIVTLENQNLHSCEAVDMVVVSHPSLLSAAQHLATLHEIFDGLNTLTVTDAQVYNEYSSGKQDPMAIRTLLRDLKARHPEAAPRYLLLMGSGTYDNRHLQDGGEVPTVVTYETPYSFDEDGNSYCSDDIMGYLADNGRGATTETMDVSVGRLPAKSLAEANHMVNKIEGYMTRRDLLEDGGHGDWRNWVALLSDDADPGHPDDSAFAHSSEVVANNINRLYPQLNIDKLYADSYHQSSGAIGSYYPDLNNALRQRMNKGCLLLNYIGHGSTSYIGTERYIELSDIDTYGNTDRLPLFVTSTCSYGRFDLPDVVSGAEACLLAPAAAVAVISASRPISHIERFNNDVVTYALNPKNTIGDALRLAKNRTSVSQCIGLTGDPALRLSQPENRVVVTHINARPVTEGVDDTATVLSRVTVSGEIQDSNGVLLTDFDGTLYPIVFDRTMRSSTLANDNPGTEVSFTQQKNILYRGSHAVEGGRFEYSFIVPQDVAYQYDYAKLSHYAKSASDHAAGSYSQLLLGGLNDSASISTSAPVVRLFIGDTNFLDGGITDANPTLVALLYDSAGINAGSGLGHDITAILDGNPNSLIVLNDFYDSDVEHAGCGSVSYQYNDLTPGPHTLTLKAWNIFNISAEASINFIVCNPDTLALSALHCYPNPAREHTQFMLEVNNTAQITSAELHIYNYHGQLVYSHTPAISADGYVVGPVNWNLSSVPPGLYLARILVTDTEGHTHQQTTKCIVR